MLSLARYPRGAALALDTPLPKPNDIMNSSSTEAEKIRILIGFPYMRCHPKHYWKDIVADKAKQYMEVISVRKMRI
jgi:hypothetical protein